MANATLYLAAKKIDIAKLVPGTTSDGGLFKSPTFFRVPVEGGVVRFTVMPADELKQHLNGFIGYVRTLKADTAPSHAAQQQIMRVKHVLGVQTDLELDESGPLGPLLLAVASAHDGFLFAFNSIILASGEPLVGPMAENRASPVQTTSESLRDVVRTSHSSADPTPAQLARRKKNTEIVRAMGLPVLETLPCAEDEGEIKPRAVAEVVGRCLANTVCAVKGESGDYKLGKMLVEKLGIASHLSPDEEAFLAAEEVSQKDRVQFAWRYECSHVFLWALGHIPELKPPSEICDVPGETGLIRDLGPKKLASEAKPRTPSQLLDAADLYYRLDWAAVELRLKNRADPQIDGGIAMERHRALNWLIRYMDQEWDDVTTDT